MNTELLNVHFEYLNDQKVLNAHALFKINFLVKALLELFYFII